MLSATRLVAVSGNAQPEDVERATEPGFVGRISNPPDPERWERSLIPALVGAQTAEPATPLLHSAETRVPLLLRYVNAFLNDVATSVVKRLR
jgi:hypothetical protein